MQIRRMVKRAKTDGYFLRFPDGLRERVGIAARMNRRSMSDEIIARLEASFAQDETIGVSEATVVERLEALETRVNAIFLDPLMDGLSALKERVAKLERKKKLGDRD